MLIAGKKGTYEKGTKLFWGSRKYYSSSWDFKDSFGGGKMPIKKEQTGGICLYKDPVEAGTGERRLEHKS